MEPREKDKVWTCGFACASLVSAVIIICLGSERSKYHAIIMDQTKVEAYRAKQAAEAALERD